MTASVTTSKSSSASNEDSSPYSWILHPVIDLLFACGGIVWLLYALHFFLAGSADIKALLAVSATGVLIFSETHTASTFLVVYRSSDVRTRFAFCTRWVAFACLALAVLGIAMKELTPILVKVYLLMVPHHFMAQSYGIAMLYCMKNGFALGRWEKRVVLLFVNSVTVFSVVKQLTYKEWSGDVFLAQPIPYWPLFSDSVCRGAEAFLIGSAIVFSIMIAKRAVQSGQLFPVPAQLTILTGVTAFVLAPLATGIFWLYVSAFFHGSQYLMVVAAKVVKEQVGADCKGKRLLGRMLSPFALRFFAATAGLSILIYKGIPGALQYAGLEYVTVAAAIFTTVNYFHIITDGVIWRLRDPNVSAKLVT